MIARRWCAFAALVAVLAGCGANPEAGRLATGTTPGTPATTVAPSTTVAKATAADFAADTCRAFASFLELVHAEGQPASLAVGETGGMVQDAGQAVQAGGGAARWVRFERTFAALATAAASQAWRPTPAAAGLPAVRAAVAACRPYTS
jgi:hypothetical protein